MWDQQHWTPATRQGCVLTPLAAVSRCQQQWFCLTVTDCAVMKMSRTAWVRFSLHSVAVVVTRTNQRHRRYSAACAVIWTASVTAYVSCVISVAVVLQSIVSKDIIDIFSVCDESFRPQHRTLWYSTTVVTLDDRPLTRTVCVRLERYDWNHASAEPVTPRRKAEEIVWATHATHQNWKANEIRKNVSRSKWNNAKLCSEPPV